MNFLIITIIPIFILSHNLLGNIQFSADALTIQLPATIVASGNSKFQRGNLIIFSEKFKYNTKKQSASFNNNVVINYEKSKLKGNSFQLNLKTKKITGYGNIILKNNNLLAYSNNLEIKNYEVLTLKNNVRVKREGSQIKSNQLMYNLKTDTILSNERVKLTIEE